MIFHEIYGCYYGAVARILALAVDGQLTREKLQQIASENAFAESGLTIIPALESARWPLLYAPPKAVSMYTRPEAALPHAPPKAVPLNTLPKDAPLHTPLKSAPDIPLTLLERRWLKAILLDPRMRLFFDVEKDAGAPDGLAAMLSDVEPLFTPADYVIFDKYKDGDPYTDSGYIRRFRRILDAIRHQNTMRFIYRNRKGRLRMRVGRPEGLEYSEKDDKFRVQVQLRRQREIINLGRLNVCEVLQGGAIMPDTASADITGHNAQATGGAVTGDCARETGNAARATAAPEFVAASHQAQVPEGACETFTMELVDERNALERVLLHFAHFRKEARRLEDGRYSVTIHYDRGDETELVIRVLSFGPMVRVTEPEPFVNLIKERLKMQISCGLR